jgi:hypothetical protein
MKKILTLAFLALALVAAATFDMTANSAQASASGGKDSLVWLMEDKDIESIIIPDGRRETRPALVQLSVAHAKQAALAILRLTAAELVYLSSGSSVAEARI